MATVPMDEIVSNSQTFARPLSYFFLELLAQTEPTVETAQCLCPFWFSILTIFFNLILLIFQFLASVIDELDFDRDAYDSRSCFVSCHRSFELFSCFLV
jgi:hypothetical protein